MLIREENIIERTDRCANGERVFVLEKRFRTFGARKIGDDETTIQTRRRFPTPRGVDRSHDSHTSRSLVLRLFAVTSSHSFPQLLQLFLLYGRLNHAVPFSPERSDSFCRTTAANDGDNVDDRIHRT